MRPQSPGTEALRSSMSTDRFPLWVVSWDEPQPYREFWELQKRLWRACYEERIPDTLLLLEHQPVVTLGKNAHRENLLLPDDEFAARGVDLVDVDRGGDVTYHGPGQLVGYWIFDLRKWHRDVHRYLREIEEVLIRSLGGFGIESGRSEGATGVWVGDEKIAAMGLHLSHWVSTHGFALNRDVDLRPFGWIVPCGLRGRGVTSISKLGHEVSRVELEARIVSETEKRFGRRAVRSGPEALGRHLNEPVLVR